MDTHFISSQFPSFPSLSSLFFSKQQTLIHEVMRWRVHIESILHIGVFKEFPGFHFFICFWMDTLGRGRGIDLLRVVIVIHTVQSYFFFEFGVHSARFGKWCMSVYITFLFSIHCVYSGSLHLGIDGGGYGVYCGELCDCNVTYYSRSASRFTVGLLGGLSCGGSIG